jgi:hypothetical protein
MSALATRRVIMAVSASNEAATIPPNYLITNGMMSVARARRRRANHPLPRRALSGQALKAAIVKELTESQAAAEWRAFIDSNLDRAGRSAKWRVWLHRSQNFKSQSRNEKGNIPEAASRLPCRASSSTISRNVWESR